MAAGGEADGGAFAFAFTVCQVGAEPAVKAEVAKFRPDWRLAFSRPGLVTFKCAQPVTLAALPRLVFARVRGASLGPAKEAAQVAQLAHAVAQRLARPVRLAV